METVAVGSASLVLVSRTWPDSTRPVSAGAAGAAGGEASGAGAASALGASMMGGGVLVLLGSAGGVFVLAASPVGSCAQAIEAVSASAVDQRASRCSVIAVFSPLATP